MSLARKVSVQQSLDNLAVLYQAQGRYAEAEPLHQRSLAIFEKALGPEHPDVAQSLNDRPLNPQARTSAVTPANVAD